MFPKIIKLLWINVSQQQHFWGWIILCCWVVLCIVRCLASIPDLSPTDATTTLILYMGQSAMSPDIVKCPLEGRISPRLESLF